MIADVVPGQPGSGPYPWVLLGGAVYFVNHAGQQGRLWKTDLAASGAAPVFAVPSADGGPSRVTGILRSGDSLFGIFDDGIHGFEPWWTDGTREGSRLAADIDPGEHGSMTGDSDMVDLDGGVLFDARDPELGSSLWRAAAAEEGATRIHTVSPDRMRRLGSRVYFRGFDRATGWEPWQTDGTPAGTRLVADIVPGGQDSSWVGFSAAGATVYFAPFVPSLGYELWKVLPEGGAALVKDVWPGAQDGFQAHSSGLWRTDGTATGTRLLAPGVRSPFAAAGSRVVFFRRPQLWASDLAGSTVAPLAELPGPQLSDAETIGSAGGRALIFGYLEDGYGLWGTDGTEEGTVFLGAYQGWPDWWSAGPGGDFHVGLDDGVTGLEPWATDGTTEGTRLLADLVPGPGSSYPLDYAASGETISFFTLGAEKLWVSDGTTEGTREIFGVGSSDTAPRVGTLAIAGGAAFFADVRAPSFGLWRTEGAGVALVAEITDGSPGVFLGVGDLLFFTVRRGGPGGVLHELWRSDGTTAGTFPLASFSHPQFPFFLGEVAGVVLFSASQGSGPFPGVHGLWRSDGTAAGTREVQAITAGGPVVTLGMHAYFPADDGVTGMELWSARTSILAGNATLALEELRAELDELGLPLGIARSLRAKLAQGGSGGLEAFLRELDALPAKVLDPIAAESLRGLAVEILELLSAP